MPEDRLLICVECKFPNMPGARTCLTCKAPLKPRSAGGPLTAPTEPPSEAGRSTVRLDRRLLEGGDIPHPIADTPTRPFVRPRGGGLPRPVELRSEPVPITPDGPIVGWLRCEPLPPIALGPKRTVTMGRGPDCDLILPHPTVSRVHAVIRVLGRQLVFEDRSSYGSFLNARPVSSAQLSVGDRIGIGPYEVRVLAPDASEQESEGGEEHTQPLDFTSFRQVPAQAELLGSLERVSLLEILQTIELHGKSGTLKVTSGSLAGELTVREGRPQNASLGELRDEEAVLSMVLLREGSFCFWGGELPPDVPVSMTSSLTRLLLEASRRQDESDQGSVGLEPGSDVGPTTESAEDTHHP